MDANFTQSLNLSEVSQTVNCYVYNLDLVILLLLIIAGGTTILAVYALSNLVMK